MANSRGSEKKIVSLAEKDEKDKKVSLVKNLYSVQICHAAGEEEGGGGG